MQIRGLLLDVEGVLVADKRYIAVEGAPDFVHAARAADCPLRLITNNTTDDPPTLHEKLSRAGFDFKLDEIHTCTNVAVRRLRALHARRCLVLGNAALRKIFSDAGFETVDGGGIDAVVVGLDTELTYARLQAACDAVVSQQAALLTLHHNRLYLDANGRPAPSVGAITSAIEHATQIEAEVLGKPSPEYFQPALDELGVPTDQVLVVSDDPLTDLTGARRMGMKTAFVLSGKYDNEFVLTKIPEKDRPDLVAPTLADLYRQKTITF